MILKTTILFICNIYLSSAALFIWSNHEIKISPFEEFTTKDFLKIIDTIEKPDVYVFRSPNYISKSIMSAVQGFYSIYSANAVIEMENMIDLNGNAEKDLQIINKTIGDSKNFISTIIIPSDNTRCKRDIESYENGTEKVKETETEQNSKSPPSKGPVIYRSFKTTKNNEKLYALLYSSRPLLYRTNNSDPSEINLGNVDDFMIIYDTRLNINIPNGLGKIILRFNFSLQNGYWYVQSVKITDTHTKDSKAEYNLVTKNEIVAPIHFSYHCNGETKFSDSNGVELVIYDLQIQPFSKNGKFGDANDCVSFTTAPICSGILITLILGVGLVIALISIMDIKTMDKFDNYKTKNLVITVSE